jgi:pilus assembly protein CpaF
LDEDRTDPGLNAPAGRSELLEQWLGDPRITEIIINDVRNVFLESEGTLHAAGFRFSGQKELRRAVDLLLEGSGKELTVDQPCVDLNLRDGSRVHIVGPPVAPFGPCITIRKFPRRFALDDLMRTGMLDERMERFLRSCVLGKVNVLVSGGTDTGKTTFLNALIDCVPNQERIVTVEDTPELTLVHSDSVKLLTQLPRRGGQGGDPGLGGVTARELVANALRMRPDRIIVGECRRTEAFDVLQAMNTGHAGSMTTIHANSPRDALGRLETLCQMAGCDLPLLAIRKQMASALDVIVQLKRLRGGKRYVSLISELTGMEGEVLTLQELFRGEAEPRADTPVFRGTGLVPTFLDRLRENGVELPPAFFA